MDSFDVKARVKERAFVKRLRQGAVYTTGNGHQNSVDQVTERSIHVSTKSGKAKICISRSKLREAIRYLYFRRTATRKELEAYSQYNSSLLGLLRLVFADIAKVTKTVRGLLRLTIRGVRYFFAGAERCPKDLALAKQWGAKFVLMTYAHIRDDRTHKWRQHCERLGLKVLLDSGEFTLYKARTNGKEVRPIHVEEYADFIQKHRDILYGWFNLDRVGDPVESKRNADFLRKEGVAPIEIWHVQSGFDVLEALIQEDHELIAIGGSVFMSTKKKREIFKELFSRFPEQNFHLLGGGSPLCFEFPWFSCDATSWLGGRMFGKLTTPSGNTKAPADWTAEQCLSYNVMQLSRMEENHNHEGTVQLEFLLPPAHPKAI